MTNDPSHASALTELAALNVELTKKGGPSEDGQLFEKILDLQQRTLKQFGLPTSPANEQLLWFDGIPSEAEITGRITQLQRTATKYLLSSPETELKTLRAALQMQLDPFDVLPEIKVELHIYTLFVYNKILLPQEDTVDAVLQEFKVVNNDQVLDTLGRLKEGKLENKLEAIRWLQSMGLKYVNGFMHDNANL
jgi:hypothetical protein